MFENDNQYPNDVNYGSWRADNADNDQHYNDYSHYYGENRNQMDAGEGSYSGADAGTSPDTDRGGYDRAGADTDRGGYDRASAGADRAGYDRTEAETGRNGYAAGYNADAGYAGRTYRTEREPNSGGDDRSADNTQTWDADRYAQSEGKRRVWEHADVKAERERKAKARKAEKKSGGGFGRRALKLAGSGLIFGAAAGVVIAGILYLSPVRMTEGARTETAQNAVLPKAEQVEPSKRVETNATVENAAVVTDVSAVVDEVMPSVVSITGLYKVENFDAFGSYFGFSMPEQEEEGSGSGIIVGQNDEELLIATNNHVVEDATTLSVQFIDGESVDAQVKGTESKVDLAVIAVPISSIKDSTFAQIKIANLGDSDALKVGEPAIAIGNALGYGQSVTTGVISAVNREYTQDGTTNYLIQTDAAINPGNSGGALLNIKGEVIGINSNKIAGSAVEGMGYAIPISTAKPIIEELMSKQTRVKIDDQEEKAFLGISGINVTEEVSSTYGLPEGIYISQVYENTAAAKAGLTKGDILVEFDGEKVESLEELTSLLEYYKKGTTVDVVIMQGSPNGYQQKTITVTLGGRTDS